MAKDKDRALNPAAAQRKAEKQKALKKGRQTPSQSPHRSFRDRLPTTGLTPHLK